LVVVAWGVTGRLLAEHGVRLLPLGVARQLSLQSYLAWVNVVVTAFGLLLSVTLLERPWQALGVTAPRPAALVRLLLATPAVYVAVSYAAVLIALPSLLAELRAQGVEGVRQSTGEFGNQVLHSPAALALLWAALIAPAAEELWFRGALWSLLEQAVKRVWPAPAGAAAPASLPEGVVEPSRVVEFFRGVPGWFREGGIATLLVTALFAATHADTPGGMGIVRVVSAAGLGFACGVVRQATRSTVAAFALHCVFNALSLATARRWVVTPAFPTRLMVPTLLSLLAVAGLVALAALVVLSRKRTR
jgi:membrane protease YdiL (CAAX protease family)